MKIYPVLHVNEVQDVVAETEFVVRNGADGVFLIDHEADDARLVESVLTIRRALPSVFLGVNVIRRSLVDSLRVVEQGVHDVNVVDALWVDDAGLNRAGDPDPQVRAGAEKRALADYRACQQLGWTGVYFGGVAFKYQHPVPDDQLEQVGSAARRWIGVPTTSGPGTGQQADLARLKALRRGLGDHPLALASGVTPDNVARYRGHVDHVLVSTGIRGAQGQIDPGALERLVSATRSSCA